MAWRDAFDSACTARSTQAVNVLVIGDSISEGQGASVKANRWMDILLGYLRTDYPTASTPGGAGYLPGWYAVYSPSSPWANTNPVKTGTTTDTWFGLGGRGTYLAAGNTMVWTITGTSVEIWWGRNTTTGTFSWKVDAGSATNVNTSGSYALSQKTTINLGSAGSHTLTLTGVSGTCGIEGVFVYNGDETNGFHFFDHTHTGVLAGSFNGSDIDLYTIPNNVQPDLAILELVGGNDFLNSTNSPATVKTAVQATIAELNSLAKVPSILMVIPYGASSAPNGSGYYWSDFVTQLRTITGANLKTLDLYAIWNTADGSGNYDADGLHPSNAGHLALANIIRQQLTINSSTISWIGV